MSLASSSTGTPLRRRPDRVPLPLQQAGHAGPARGPGHAARPSSTSCADFWWHRVRVDGQPRGLYNLLTRGQFDAALERFEPAYPPDPVGACRRLFVELLWPLATEQGKPGLVEMSSHNVREAQTLRRLFPEARFVHAVRDGRDAASSVVTKTWGPDSIVKGIDWWADRLRAIEAGVRGEEDGAAYALGPEQLFVVPSTTSSGAIARRPTAGCSSSSAVDDDAAMREFFDAGMSPAAAHVSRWREGLAAGRPAAGCSDATSTPWRRSSARATTRRRRAAASSGVASALAERRILFMTSNGTGLGHLTRSMAIARRLGSGRSSRSFFTLSAAAPVVAASWAFRSSTWPPTGRRARATTGAGRAGCGGVCGRRSPRPIPTWWSSTARIPTRR